MEQAVLSRRERNKETTRLALHEAALALTEERGLARVTIEAITERADVAPRTFSNYFACKEDAIVGLDPCAAERMAEALTARPAGENPLEALRVVLGEYMTARFHPVESARRRVRLVNAYPGLKARMAGQFENMTADMIRVVAERTGVDPTVELFPTLVVSAAANAARSAILWWSAHPDGPDLARVLSQTFDLLAVGLVATSPGPSPRRGRHREVKET